VEQQQQPYIVKVVMIRRGTFSRMCDSPFSSSLDTDSYTFSVVLYVYFSPSWIVIESSIGFFYDCIECFSTLEIIIPIYE
jgi:hypothetical protein